MGNLTVVGVRNAKPGRHADGDGLYLLVKPTGARSWLLRIQADGRRRDIGLGTADLAQRSTEHMAIASTVPILNRRVLSLAEAREKSDLLRRLTKGGLDPIVERDRERKTVPTFERAMTSAHEALKAGWAEKNAAAFLASLREHAIPILGHVRVNQIDTSHIRDTLAPIWTAKPEMARKIRQRINAVLNFAKSKGWRESEAPGRSVTVGLARRAAGGNFAAMPFGEVPSFMAALRSKEPTVGRLALQFVVLTAARSGEVRNARWAQIDCKKKLWNRPAEIMKAKVAHAVTLTDEAVAVLDQMQELSGAGELIFPSAKGTPLSDNTLSKIMRDAKLPYAVHGFRSSFRDWAAEKMPHIPDAVAEAALAHVVPDKVVRAYKRTTFLEMRRELVEGWGHLCCR